MYRRFYGGTRQQVKIESSSNSNPTGSEGGTVFLKTNELIQLQEAARLSGFSVSYLRDIAQRGRLWAVKRGRKWFTTLAAVEEYKDNRYMVKKVFI